MIGAVGEIVGAVAVVVSLVYLAQQVRVSNRLARAEAWRAIATSANTLNGSWGRDPDFRRVFAQVLEGATREEIAEEDRFLIGFYLLSTAQSYDQLFREVQEGVLTPRVLEEFSGTQLFSTPYFRSSWHVLRNFVPRTLAVHMEERFDLGPSRVVEDPPVE
jgi:hypothetical protein